MVFLVKAHPIPTELLPSAVKAIREEKHSGMDPAAQDHMLQCTVSDFNEHKRKNKVCWEAGNLPRLLSDKNLLAMQDTQEN